MDNSQLSDLLMQMARTDGKMFVTILEKVGVDFDGIAGIEIARKLVQSSANISDEAFAATDFVFWIAYFVEWASKDLIIEPEMHVGIRKDFVDFLNNDILNKRQKKELELHLANITNPSIDLADKKVDLEEIVNTLSLGNKISIIERFYSSDRNDPLIVLMKVIKRLRNDIAHGRFNNLKYDSLDLSTGRGQVRIFTDLMNAYSKPQ